MVCSITCRVSFQRTEIDDDLDFQDSVLQQLLKDLIEEKFDPYLTSVGGSGLGILSPYPQHRHSSTKISGGAEVPGQVTPPETPLADVLVELGEATEPLRPAFEVKPVLELSA